MKVGAASVSTTYASRACRFDRPGGSVPPGRLVLLYYFTCILRDAGAGITNIKLYDYNDDGPNYFLSDIRVYSCIFDTD